MIIDCHAHVAPPSLMDDIQKNAASYPSLKLIPDPAGGFGLSFAGGKPTRPVAKPLSDIDARVKWMDGQKIERQVTGGWLDMFGYELPAEEGLRWSRLINKHLAELAATNSRFVALASVVVGLLQQERTSKSRRSRGCHHRPPRPTAGRGRH